MAQSKRDENRVTTAIGVSSLDFSTPINAAVDPTSHAWLSALYGFDGSQLQQLLADALSVKVTVVATVTYVGLAAPGTLQSASTWQCKKIDETTGTVVTWADGNANFDNVATDLTVLTYS